jgi:hypothetical protein
MLTTPIADKCLMSPTARHNHVIGAGPRNRGEIMTPADKRMTELLGKWLTSLELHLKYADLPDTAYFAVQPWPKHDRPTRWILELAKQKVLELKGQLEARIAMGDSKYAESLELTGFLANLVGSQHVQRFIPLAESDKEQGLPPAAEPAPASSGNTTIQAAAKPRHGSPVRMAEADTTREMPRVAAAPAQAHRPVEDANPGKQSAAPKPAARPTRKAQAPVSATGKGGTSPALQKKVMSDAVRLLKWGKEWHELAELIARIADRPPVAEVRRILRSHKAEIEMQAEGDE